MGNKTKIPQERADMYKELLGEQKGDKVTITGNRDRKKDTSAFVTNIFTTILAACKWIAVLIPFIALITYSVIESISYFKYNLSVISDKTFSKIFSLFFDYIVILFKPLIVTIAFIAIALVIFNFIEFLYYSILYLSINSPCTKNLIFPAPEPEHVTSVTILFSTHVSTPKSLTDKQSASLIYWRYSCNVSAVQYILESGLSL